MTFNFRLRLVSIILMASLVSACRSRNTPDQQESLSATSSSDHLQPAELDDAIDLQKVPAPGFINISELFLLLPEEYLFSLNKRDNAWTKEERGAILTEKSTFHRLEVLNTRGGYLRFSEAGENGQLLTEITYFKNSQGDKLVGIHQYWRGKVEVTTAIYFVEQTHSLWIDRTAGVIPLTTPSDFIPPMARDGLANDLEKIKTVIPASVGNRLSIESFLLYQLPEKGKDLKVECGKIMDQQLLENMESGITVASEVMVYPWTDGVFNTHEGKLLNHIMEVPNALFTLATQNEDFQPFIPEDKDSPANRMRLIKDNDAWNERVVVGSHPDVYVREGAAHVAWYTPPGHKQGFMGVWVSRGMGYPSLLYFLKPMDGDWVDITEEVLSGIDQVAIDEGLARLNPEWVTTEKITLDQLEYELIPAQNRIHVLYPAEYWGGETTPVLIDLKWNKSKFKPFP